MSLDEKILNTLPIWLDASGSDSEFVLSTRIRLARNLDKLKFVKTASVQERLEVYNIISAQKKNCSTLKKHSQLDIDRLDELSSKYLLERHLVSQNIIEQEGKRGIIIDKNQSLSVMINEEDHLRIQSIVSGFNPKFAWNTVNVLDDELSKVVDYAFSKRWGYLTACPTNTGTGIRISVLVHLPALVLTKDINKVINGINYLGFSVRGFFGEGSDVLGNMFQISNRATLGKTEEDTIESIEKIIKQIITYEKNACSTLLKDAKPQIEDKICRALGVLKNARLINADEFMSLSSAVRLGVTLGIIKNIELKTLNELITLLLPAHLQITHSKKMNKTQRNALRAQIVREKLS